MLRPLSSPLRGAASRWTLTVEVLARGIEFEQECVPDVYRQAVGSEQESATPLNNRELHSFKMVEAAGIEPASETKSAEIYYVRSRSLRVSSSALSTDGATHRNQLSKVSSAPPERELGQSCKNWHRGPPRRLNRPQWATLIA